MVSDSCVTGSRISFYERLLVKGECDFIKPVHRLFFLKALSTTFIEALSGELKIRGVCEKILRKYT